jgi:ATP-grasp domain-containing protein
MIDQVYIQEKGMGRMEPEMSDLYVEFRKRGYPVSLFTEKSIFRKRLALSKSSLVAGDIPVVLSALKQIGIQPPIPNDYPSCLSTYLRRAIWESDIARTRELILSGDFRPFFAKPKNRLKGFTGRLFGSIDDLAFISNLSARLPVICSEPVEWICEYRVFVIAGKIVGTRHYKGDETVRLDHSVVEDAISAFEQSGESHAAYAIDFGALNDGATALVEVNDGFSVGSYGLDPEVYANFIIARWEELVRDE